MDNQGLVILSDAKDPLCERFPRHGTAAPKLDTVLNLYTPPLPGLNAFVKKSSAVLVVSLLLAVRAYAGQATLAWDANTDPAVTGYMVYYGQSSRNYTGKADAGKQTSYTVAALRDGQTYFYAVTAYDAGRAESAYSNEASATVPAAGSAPIATPTTGGTSNVTNSGGGGGGCTVGTSAYGMSGSSDPTFLMLLFAAVLGLRSRKQSGRRIGPGPFLRPFLTVMQRAVCRNNKMTGVLGDRRSIAML